jgi:hypothetical protein
MIPQKGISDKTKFTGLSHFCRPKICFSAKNVLRAIFHQGKFAFLKEFFNACHDPFKR